MKLLRAYVLNALLPLMRTPAYWVPLVAFPALLFSFFGISPAQTSPQLAAIMVASWSTFAVVGVGFFQFGVSISQARESRWEDYSRTLPAGGAPKFFAQIVSAAVFLFIALAAIWVVAILTTPIAMPLSAYLKLLLVLTLGVIPFVLLGAALGYSVPARGAVAIANLIYLPLSYLGGLWIPPDMLPGLVAKISPTLPTRQLAELAWSAVLGHSAPYWAFLGLCIYSGLALLAATIMWRRDEANRFQ